MNERLKMLRSTLGLTQEDMGKKLGVTKTAICALEAGRRNFTEQMLLSICREFRVNYFWLTDGKGEVFTGTPQTLIDELSEDFQLDDIDKQIIQKYLELDPDKRAVIKQYLKDVFI